MVSGTKKNEKGFDVKNRVIREEGCRATLISRPMLLLIEIDNRSSSILSKRKKKNDDSTAGMKNWRSRWVKNKAKKE